MRYVYQLKQWQRINFSRGIQKFSGDRTKWMVVYPWMDIPYHLVYSHSFRVASPWTYNWIRVRLIWQFSALFFAIHSIYSYIHFGVKSKPRHYLFHLECMNVSSPFPTHDKSTPPASRLRRKRSPFIIILLLWHRRPLKFFAICLWRDNLKLITKRRIYYSNVGGKRPFNWKFLLSNSTLPGIG